MAHMFLSVLTQTQTHTLIGENTLIGDYIDILNGLHIND
jgi:hypothetical protein